MENVRKRIKLDLVRTEDKIRKLTSDPKFISHKIFRKDLVAIHTVKSSVKLNKPIITGLAILELSKLHMYKFHYGVIKEKYGNNAKLLFTDTDSLCYHKLINQFYLF